MSKAPKTPLNRSTARVSKVEDVRAFYDETAAAYAKMMDDEIRLPLYDKVLGGLVERVRSLDGAVLDSSCGTGHMLEKLRDEQAPQGRLIGVELSPEMVRAAQQRLGKTAEILEGDMRAMPQIANDSCAAVISFFALHHVDGAGLGRCLSEWRRVLCAGGELVLATWEGEGAIDYGKASDIVTRRYREAEVRDASRTAGLKVERIWVDPVEGMDMSAIYMIASKPRP